MSRAFQVLSLSLIALLASARAEAQLDSSSAVLLRSSKSANTKQNLDSSRYKIRAPESRKDDDEIEEKPGTMIPTPVPSKSVKSTAKASSNSGTTTTTTTLEVTNEPPPASATVPAPVVVVEPTPAAPVAAPAATAPPTATPVAEQVRELLFGDKEEIEEVKTQIHPQDPRANILDITLAPAYFYNGSDSGYSFRRYNSNGPGLGLGANLWFTPFFGVQSRFFTSFSSSIRSGGTNMVPMDVQAFEAGIRFRKHFGYSRKATQLIWGIDYHDAINKIGRESTTALGRKSSGVAVSIGAVVPSSVTYSHTMQIDILPRMKHNEMNTGIETKSGAKAETNAVTLSVGGEWVLDRRNQVFWKGQYSVERNLFKGGAALADPHTGLTPDGVSVTNSLAIFYFGFKWGS